jgi:hypothetical protein
VLSFVAVVAALVFSIIILIDGGWGILVLALYSPAILGIIAVCAVLFIVNIIFAKVNGYKAQFGVNLAFLLITIIAVVATILYFLYLAK